MLRKELIVRLMYIQSHAEENSVLGKMVLDLVDDIEQDGVLDVQAPDDIVASMELPIKQPKAVNRWLKLASEAMALGVENLSATLSRDDKS